MNRRELIKTAGIATAATVLPITLANAQTPNTTDTGMAIGGAKIAGTREDFEAEFGPGTDTNGGGDVRRRLRRHGHLRCDL